MQNRYVATIPFSPKLGDMRTNINDTVEVIEHLSASKNKPALLLFPELSLTGYLLENLVGDVAISINDALLDKIKTLSKHFEIIVGLVLRENNQLFNAMVSFYHGEIIHIQKKIYPPTYGMFDERRYFARGSELSMYHGALGNSGILICEDAWHASLVYTLYASGVDYFFVASASPSRGLSANAESFVSRIGWVDRLKIYAESMGKYFFYTNLSCSEDGVLFGGDHFAITPDCSLRKATNNIIEMNHEDFEVASKQGGPFQEEDFLLNEALLQKAHEARKRTN